MNRHIILHRFTLPHWEVYKNIRLEALLTERGVYCSNFAEAALINMQWQERLLATDRAQWGLYDADVCIGLTGVVATGDNTANLIASYIHPSYRGGGLSQLFYDARIAWARAQGIRAITVSHRAGNEASRRANQRVGFAYTHTEPKTWPDGETAGHVFYKLEL